MALRPQRADLRAGGRAPGLRRATDEWGLPQRSPEELPLARPELPDDGRADHESALRHVSLAGGTGGKPPLADLLPGLLGAQRGVEPGLRMQHAAGLGGTADGAGAGGAAGVAGVWRTAELRGVS